MRNAFAAEITALAQSDERVVLISGDIGNRLFNRFKENCPERFFNCGVAEANMISLAAGMAACGLRPVAYTIAAFATTRCFEQIRVDLCYQALPVIIVGVGAGFSYASLGATHHACEDIAIMRALPLMTVVCPGDPIEVRLALRAAVQRDGPVYIRLGKKGERQVHEREPTFQIGRALVVRPGREVCLLCTGTMLAAGVEAADELARQGVSAEVVSFHTVKPLDEERLAAALTKFQVVATIEEHSVVGGFGGAVAEWLADHPGRHARLLRLGSSDSFLHAAGDQAFARANFGLSATAIAATIMKEVGA